jgi:UDP-galactopyranose mutase
MERGARVKLVGSTLSRFAATRVSETLWLAPTRGLVRALPLSYPEITRRYYARYFDRFIRRELKGLGMVRPVLWFYWWFFPELVRIPHAATLYDVIDDHADYGHNARWSSVVAANRRLEDKLLRGVDLAYALSPALAESYGKVNDSMRFLPPGIDLQKVEHVRGRLKVPREMADLPRPIVGYVGQIGSRLDWALLGQLVSTNPEWTFVFVGGAEPPEAPDAPNLHFFGPRSYEDILQAASTFDVGIIPFKNTPSTRGAYSYKALDYLSLGKPVVATRLPFTIDIDLRFPGAIEIATSVAEWRQGIARALQSSADPRGIELRLAAARDQTTGGRVERMICDVRSVLAPNV